MKTFEELKEELLTRAKNAGACQSGYAMGLRSNTKADLLKAITENWFWVLRYAKLSMLNIWKITSQKKNYRKPVFIPRIPTRLEQPHLPAAVQR